jgi:hypothetical protein
MVVIEFIHGFGGMQYTSVCNPLEQSKWFSQSYDITYLGLVELCEYIYAKKTIT